MRNLLLLLCAILLSLSAVGAQTPAQPVGRDVQVQLTSSIRAKKAKVGDLVSAVTVIPVTLAQGVAVPAGSKVTGHVRQVEADSGDAHTSFIALSFDEVALKHGQTVSLNSFVRAALMPALRGTTAQESQQGQNMAPMQSPTRGGMMNGGMGGPMGGMMSAPPMGNSNPTSATSTPPAQPQEPAKPVAARTGEVVGMRGVELQVTNPEHLSVFRSVHKNLELDEGLQLMLVVQ